MLVDGAVERLVELGLLDDEAFARAWIASRDRARPRGERALRRELLLKGIAKPTIDELLAERGSSDAPDRGRGIVASPDGPAIGDEAAAARLLERRRASLERVADPRARRSRAYALLARNGFDPEVAARAVERFGRADALTEDDG